MKVPTRPAPLSCLWLGSMLVLGLLASGTLYAQDAGPSGQELAAKVRELAAQLNDPELARRDEAERKLIELGPEVLDLLPKTTQRLPAEVEHRLMRVREKLQRGQAEAAVQPSLVTLQGQGLPLTEVMAAIEQQTGNRLVDFRQRFGQEVKPIKLDLALEREPFWPALDRILDQAQLSVYNFSGQSALALNDRDQGQLPRSGRASYSGPFRLAALHVAAERNLRNPLQRALKLQIEVAWEPRLSPISISQSLAQLTAVDEAAQPFAISAEDAVLEVPVRPGTTAVELEIPFQLPPRSVAKIARLEGTLQALVPGRVEAFRFDNLAQAGEVQVRKGGTVVTLESMRRANELWQARIRVSFDQASGALESHRGWVFNNPCYVVGADGKRIEHAGFETTRQAENEVGMAYLFDLPAGPQGLSLVYETPAAILRMPIKYELKDIELP